IIFIQRLSTKKMFFLVTGIVLLLFTAINVVLSLINNPVILSKIQYYQSDVSPFGPAISHVIVASAASIFLYFNKEYFEQRSKRTKNIIYMLERINIVSLIYIPLYF